MSEAAVWSVLGRRGLIDYHRQRVKAVVDIPALRNTGYSGCFHDTTKVLSVVEETHREVIHRRRATIDNIVGSVLLTVSGMMMQDPTRRPDAWKVYDDLARAVDLAKPPVFQPITPPPTRISNTQPLPQYNYVRSSMPVMPVMSSPDQTGLGLNIDELSLQSRIDIQGRQANHSLPLSLSVPSSIEKGKARMGDPWTPPPPVPSPVPQYGKSVGLSARPKLPITQVLEYIRQKKMYSRAVLVLPGEEWLKTLGGRDQVFEHAWLDFGKFADRNPIDFPRR